MQSLGLLLHNAAQNLKREFERNVRPHGLTLLQWRVLGVLAQDDGQTQTALGARVDASPMTVSDVLERLETGGLIAREVDPSDSRAKRVQITPEGRRKVDCMRGIAAKVYERAAEGISDPDRDAMIRALTQMVSNLETLDDKAKEKTR